MARREFCRALARVAVCSLVARCLHSWALGVEEWPRASITRVAVRSTNLSSIGYDRRTQLLEIEFRTGSVYRYRNVPTGTYEALMGAESKGRYFSQQIRGRYEFKRIDGSRQ